MKQDSLLRSTTLFSIATLASRFLGLARDACIAAFVPKAWQDIFWAGFKIPSTFRQLFAEGALSAAFIPLFTRVKEREGEDKAQELGFAVFHLLAISVTVIIVLAILLAPFFVPLIINDLRDIRDTVYIPLPGFAITEAVGILSIPTGWRVPAGVLASQIMFPFLFFIALSAWSMGVLNTYRYFFMPALASAFFNVSLIIACLLGAPIYSGYSLLWLLGGAVIFGGFLQYFVQIPQSWIIGYFPPAWVSPFHPKIKTFLRMLAPSAFGLAIYQINALITQTYFAAKYGEGGISTMQYAFRLIQFPLGVVGVALATASFPRIAQMLEQNKQSEATSTLVDVSKYLMLLMIPSAAGLIVLGPDILGAIYDRGVFRRNNWLIPTYGVMTAYCLGLFSYAMVKVLVRVFQAHHDFKTPVIIGVLSVIVNISLCLYFSGFLPIWSLGLASALASTVQFLLLFYLLRRKMVQLPYGRLMIFFLKVLAATGGMALCCYIVLVLFPISGGTLMTYSIRVALGLLIGGLSYGGIGWLLFPIELKKLLKLS